MGDVSHSKEPVERQIEVAVVALRMLAEPTRLMLLWHLAHGGEQDVTALTWAVGVPRATVSQHLAKLRLAGLVATRREGRHIFYRARGGHVRRLVDEAFNTADHQVTGAPEHD